MVKMNRNPKLPLYANLIFIATLDHDKEFRTKHSPEEFRKIHYDSEGLWYCKKLINSRKKNKKIKNVFEEFQNVTDTCLQKSRFTEK